MPRRIPTIAVAIIFLILSLPVFAQGTNIGGFTSDGTFSSTIRYPSPASEFDWRVGEFAASFWIRMPSCPRVDAQSIMSKTNGNSGWYLVIENTGVLRLSGYGMSSALAGKTNVCDDKWHLAIVQREADGYIRIYVDNENDNEVLYSGDLSSISQFIIGAWYDGTHILSQGTTIRDITVWTGSSLTYQQRSNLYNSDASTGQQIDVNILYAIGAIIVVAAVALFFIKKKRMPKIRFGGRKLMPKTVNGGALLLIVIFIILTLLNQSVHISALETFSWICLYIAEIILLYSLIKRVDRIHVHSDLSIWGLRILSGVFTVIGLYVLFFGSLLSITMYNIYVFYFIEILSLGMIAIGAFLVFKFKRRSGHIVWVGRM